MRGSMARSLSRTPMALVELLLLLLPPTSGAAEAASDCSVAVKTCPGWCNPQYAKVHYLISVVYDGKVVGGPSDQPFRSVNIAHKQHKQGAQVGRVAFDDRAPVS